MNNVEGYAGLPVRIVFEFKVYLTSLIQAWIPSSEASTVKFYSITDHSITDMGEPLEFSDYYRYIEKRTYDHPKLTFVEYMPDKRDSPSDDHGYRFSW